MVRIPKTTTEFKKKNPNLLNEDGSITVNGETFKKGGVFQFLCVRNRGTCWGWMYRNVTINDIRTTPEGTELSLDGTENWHHVTFKCWLEDIV